MRARRNEAQGWLDTAVAYKGDACVAADFGVSQQHVWLIKAGRKWGWL